MTPDAPERAPAEEPTPPRPDSGSAAPAPDPRLAAREARRAALDLVRHLWVLIAAAARGVVRLGRRASARSGALMARGRARLRPDAASTARPPAPAVRPSARAAGFRRGGRIPVLRLAGAAILLPVLALAVYLLAALLTLPPLGGAVVETGQRAITVESDDGRVFATRGSFRGQKLTQADLPPHLAQAIVAIEDRRFYSHWGIDLRGLARAAWRNFAGGGVREGGSTITQQYARLTSLNQEKSLWRKVQEAFLALRVEATMSKDEILLGYLDTAYFGAGAYGADAAARRYFGKPAKALNLPESAMLAGLVRAPSQLAPTRNLGGAKERADVVLQTMVETGAITPAAADAARKQSVTLKSPPEAPPGTNYFLDMIAGDVKRLAGKDGDITVRSTLNLDLQSLAEGIVGRRLDKDGARRKVGQAAMVVLSKEGAILAMVGGRDYEDSQFNRAVQAKRQPGSLFKLLVYLTAYEQGFTPESIVVDRPVKIGDWEPENDDGRYRGSVPLRTAFALSINTVAAELGQEVGIPAVIATARKLGIQSDLPNVPSLVLGSGGVSLLEMTRAYGSVLAGRTPLDAFAIHAIRGGTPQPLYVHADPAGGTSLAQEPRTMMLDSLQAVVESGTGRAARVPGQIIGGKTGTSQDFRDAWFIGMTPDLVVGVWIGNDDDSAMNRMFGGEMPAGIFHDFVQRASEKLTKGKPRPAAERAEAARAVATPAGAAAAGEVRGVPEVIDTGTLTLRGRPVRLLGVEGERGHLARQLASYLRRREVVCTGVSDSATARCRIEGDDLAALILAAGGARASEDAPADLLGAEEQARAERVGLWGR
ncbi:MULTISPECIES: PBP1A family penicillin-binding protein [Methylobacterium]|uniref:peptidoglycan glycosyltransferase n=1 Tax=Methylobacterium longum TaxID=767694 RepID=A0ABT8AJE4_9HYPH|nr:MULTISPECIES: PBP1A family penicillin-binding protein [Methylobacterium]MCJ2100408.1 PBP1A family penicillin-binding protein [Methylobacterium sp. E-046]MDN3569519.1 PBP1A family penicillin-binding protein [Methylobacterium longum]GJE10736.1 Biosynthetic peptidoglycan transglycosylase [Methylobacterium longum]